MNDQKDQTPTPPNRAGFAEAPLPTDLSAILRSVIRWAVEMMRADCGEIFLWDSTKNSLIQSISYGFIESYDGLVLKPGEGLAGKVYQKGEPMLIPDYGAWSGGASGYTDVPPFNCTFALPLRWNDEIVGVIALDADSRRREFDQSDIHRATLFANVATLAIKNAQIYQELENRSRAMQQTLEEKVWRRTQELHQRAIQLETSARVSREITAILDIDPLLSRVVEVIREAFHYYSVSVLLLETDPDRLTLRATSGGRGKELLEKGLVFPLNDQSLNGKSVLTKRAVVVNDITLETHYRAIPLLPDTRSELIVPLRFGDRVIGTLDVQSERPDEFDEQDILVAQSLADQIAIAIENAYLYDRSQELAVLEERTRLARELHDSVAQSLFSIDLSARAVINYLQKDFAKAEAELEELRRTTRDALQEMRSLIFDLRPASSKESGLLSQLGNEIDRLGRTGGPQIVLQTQNLTSLSIHTEHHVLKILLEALRNAIKHAQATRITINIVQDSRMLELSVCDNGIGFQSDQIGSKGLRCYGLTGLEERVDLLNGQLEITASPGEGTRVRVTLPISKT